MKISANSLSGLMKWLGNDCWRDAFQDVIGEHFGEVCEAAGIATFDELADRVGDHWFGVLWGCAFEDFLTRDTEDGNVVDDYLERRGWKEKAINKAYMTALRHSVMSLYEVSDIRPDESFLARDLVRGGVPIRVQERSATKTLKQWDRVAMRIVEVRGRTVIGGGLLPYEPELSETMLRTVQQLIDNAPMAVEEVFDALGESPSDDEVEILAIDVAMCAAASIFSSVWLDAYLARGQGPKPLTAVNAEGESIEFIQLHYPMAKGVTQKQVRAALDALPELESTSAKFWNWLRPADAESPPPAQKAGTQMMVSTMPDGSVVLGTLELKGRNLEVQVNSERRAERAKTLLDPPLGRLVGPPLMARQTVEQAMAAHRENQLPPEPNGLSPEEEREVVHRFLDEQYRTLLDNPVPMLGDMTPREAARSKKDRDKLVAWLKHLENQSAQLDDDSPMTTYDFTWMWSQLGVAKLRY